MVSIDLDYNSITENLEKKLSKKSDNEYIIYTDKKGDLNAILYINQVPPSAIKNTLKVIQAKMITNQIHADGEQLRCAIVFTEQKAYFLFVCYIKSTTPKILKIFKSQQKITPVFTKKLSNLLNDPSKLENWDTFFNRSDIIEEFYQLFLKAKDRLLANERLTGITDESEKAKFAENFLVQLLILWYLQAKGFLNNNLEFLKYWFAHYTELNYDSFFDFLKALFARMRGPTNEGIYYNDPNLGRIIVTGPAPFIISTFENIKIADDAFFLPGITENLKKIVSKKINEVPIINLFDSRDWVEGDIDEFVLGAIYEKLMSREERQETGSYYTPEIISTYISEKLIHTYIKNKVNAQFQTNFQTLGAIFHQDNIEIFDTIFKLLKDIKILDPAVGSAHFLESTLDVLADIYASLWKKSLDLHLVGHFELITSDDGGNLHPLHLFQLPETQENLFQIYIRFYVIISRSVYGVDLNPSAINVARARLFLCIAKYFQVEDNQFIKFPNVHFNLRVGNSLNGYITLPEPQSSPHSKQKSVLEFIKKNETEAKQEINNQFNLFPPHLEYIQTVASNLNFKMNLLEQAQDVQKILSKTGINRVEFGQLLKFKEILTRILIVSLDSDFLLQFNNFLEQINALFKLKLDERFSEEYELGDLKKLQKNGSFHWIFEFPVVFIENHGFDIILGNPPYGQNSLEEDEREILQKTWVPSSLGKKDEGQTYNISAIFIERCATLLHSNGYLGFIVNNSIARVDEFNKIRTFLLEKTYLWEVRDEGNAFKDSKVTLEMISIFFELTQKADYIIHITSQRSINNGPRTVPAGVWKKYQRFILYYDEIFDWIYSHATINHLHGTRGRDKDKSKTRNENFSVPYFFSGKAIKKYSIDKSEIEYASKEILAATTWKEEYENDTLLLTTKLNDRYRVILKPSKTLVGNNNIKLTIENFSLEPFALTGILNSKLMDFIVKRYILNYSELTVAFYDSITLFTPLKPPHNHQAFSNLTQYLYFVTINNLREKIPKLTRWIDLWIYEIYFSEKFFEDKIYSEKRCYLEENLSQLIEPIPFSDWYSLYAEELFSSSLPKEKIMEFEKYAKYCIEIIENFSARAISNPAIQESCNIISNHPWIKLIEDEI